MKQGRHVFSSLWIGDNLSPYEDLCLKSFIDNGHDFKLYAYKNGLKVPEGVQICDPSEIMGDVQPFAYTKGSGQGSYSLFSNIFRYKLLFKNGGWWVDTDVICLSNDIPQFNEFFALEAEDTVGSAVLKFPPQSPILAHCIESAEKIGKDAVWGQVGPQLLTTTLREQNKFDEAHSKTFCYPVHWKEALDVLYPTETQRLQNITHSSYFLHLWNEVFRRNRIPKTALPPKNSLLRALIEKHGTSGWSTEYDDIFIEQMKLVEKILAFQNSNEVQSREISELRSIKEKQIQDIADLRKKLRKARDERIPVLSNIAGYVRSSLRKS